MRLNATRQITRLITQRVQFAGGGAHAEDGFDELRVAQPVGEAADTRSSAETFHERLAKHTAARGETRSLEFRIRADATSANFIWVEMRCRPLEDTPGAECDVVAVLRDALGPYTTR